MKPFVPKLTLLAGAMDFGTGVLLVAAPVQTLARFGATLPGGDEAMVLMRWIGVFVGGVGLSYLWAIASPDAATRVRRLPGVWGATAVVRAGVAVFCILSVVTGALPPAWLVVGLTDAVLAGLQTWVLRQDWVHA